MVAFFAALDLDMIILLPYLQMIVHKLYILCFLALVQASLYNFLISTCGKCKNSDHAIQVNLSSCVYLSCFSLSY